MTREEAENKWGHCLLWSQAQCREFYESLEPQELEFGDDAKLNQYGAPRWINFLKPDTLEVLKRLKLKLMGP